MNSIPPQCALPARSLGKALLAIACWLGILIQTSAAWDYAMVDFGKDTANSGLPNYPQGLTTSLSGVPFDISPVDGENIWCPGGCGGNFGNNGTYSTLATVNLTGVQTVYALMNSGWGMPGASLTKVQFQFEGIGWTPAINLRDGTDLRDVNLLYANTIYNTSTVKAFDIPVGIDGNPDVIDMVAFELSPELRSRKLLSILFTDQRIGGQHTVLLQGITASSHAPVTPAALLVAVPEPGPVAVSVVFAIAAVGIVGRRYRRGTGA